MRSILKVTIIALLAGLSGISAGVAAEVMVLGTFHYSNPSADMINIEVDDVLGSKRQAEIKQIVDSLAEFKPDKIALELLPEALPKFNARYRAYLAGDYELGRNERQQLGMRLAARLAHERLYAVDVHIPLDFAAAFKAAERAGQGPLLERVQQDISNLREFILSTQGPDLTFGESMRLHNGKEIDKGNSSYLRMVGLGSGEDPAGAKLVADWYRRNLRIFANIVRLIESEDDRILVIYGSGHRSHLVDFIRQHPELEDVSPLDYLPSNAQQPARPKAD